MSKLYAWAVNPAKLQRAIAKVAPKNGTEEDIKAEYILIGGLVREAEEGVEEVSIEEKGTEEAPKAKKVKKNA